MDWIVFCLVNAIVATAAWLLAVRGYGERPAEAVVAFGFYVVGLVCVPILALGWANGLTRVSLFIAASGLATGIVVVALWGSARARLGEAGSVLRALVRLPIDALVQGLRSFSLAGVALLACGAIVVWTVVLTWLAPASGWDGIWYHDPIVGFAIQRHGFAWVEMPGKLELVNGYPKTSEMLSLWFAIFTGRTLLEVPNSLLAPLLIGSVYLLLRHLEVRRDGSLAFSLLFFLLPGVVLQLRSTYVDATFISVFAGSLCFLLRPQLRARDALTAILGIGLWTGMKTTG